MPAVWLTVHARHRRTSIATGRTQITIMLHKTRLPGQAELTAHLSSLVRLADDMPLLETAHMPSRLRLHPFAPV